MPYTEIKGIKIYYEDNGSEENPVIILLHGWTADHNRWGKQVDFLKDKYRIITLDLRGHGQSDKGENLDYSSIKILSEDLKILMENLKINKATIGGHSMGGMTVLQFVLDYPDKVEKLILVDTIAKFKYSFGRGILLSISNILPFESFLTMQIKRAFRKNWNKEEVEEAVELSLENPKYVVYKFYSAMKKFDVLDEISNIKVPTLIIHGGKDIQIPLSQAKKMHEKIENSKMVIIEDSGHEITIEEPDKVNNAIIEFLE